MKAVLQAAVVSSTTATAFIRAGSNATQPLPAGARAAAFKEMRRVSMDGQPVSSFVIHTINLAETADLKNKLQKYFICFGKKLE